VTDAIRCGQCGAPFRAGEERFCTYCGTQRPAPSAASVTPDRATRFAAARSDPRLKTLLAHIPATAGHTISAAFALVFLVGFCIVAAMMASAFGACGGAVGYSIGGPTAGAGGALFGLGPLLILGVGIFMLVTVASRLLRFQSAELERRLARVIDERIQVSGGENSSTTYFTTLEWEDKTRREFQNHAKLAGKIARDDLGLAYVKGDVLLEFARLDV
jgi:hypothetical protein